MGPFMVPPFINNIGVSPLTTREKRDSVECRVIMDLSFPPGGSVNDFIPGDDYLGQPIELKYPTIDTLAKRIYKLGRRCLLWKRDVSRCFRQIPVCPGSYSFLGWRWRNWLFLIKVCPWGSGQWPTFAKE